MANQSFDNESYQDIRPGEIDVDDLFDNHDKPFEEHDVEINMMSEEDSTEDYSDYIFNSNDIPTKLSDNYEDDDDDDNFEDEDNDDDEYPDYMYDGDYSKDVIEDTIEDTESEEIEESLDEEDILNDMLDDDIIERSEDNIENDEISAEIDENMEKSEEKLDINTAEKEAVSLEIFDLDEAFVETTKEDVEDESTELEDIVDEDDNFIEDDIEEENIDDDIEPESEEDILNDMLDTVTTNNVEQTPDTDQEHDDVVDDVEDESIELEDIVDKDDNFIEDDDEEESDETEQLTSEEKEYYETEADGSLSDFMNKSFRAKVQDIKNRYTENSLLNYIEGHSSKEYKDLIKEQYYFEYSAYHKYIDFTNPNAKAALWVLVIGEFADMIEMKKYNGEIQPVVYSTKKPYEDDPNNIEDENITTLKDKRRREFIEQSKYGIDRVVWEIDDEIAEENTSVFDEQKDLFSEFKRTEFYAILTQVLESTRIVDMSKVECKVIIKESCGYYPIIDFNTGIRVICIDTEDTSQYNNYPLFFNRKLPFSFKIPRTGIKTRIIYSDICREAPIATVFALKKLVAYEYFKPRYKINLANNYVISYTTEKTYLDMFENGDPDSKRPGSSTYYSPKPATNFIGIVVLDKKTERDIKSIHRNQIYRDLNKMPEVTVDNYDPQFILSAHYIRNDLRLRNPTIPVNQRFVEYTITQYTECNSVIINDGILVTCACIIKEHKANYAPGTPYSISFEFDRDNLLTPAVVRMLDERAGFEPSTVYRCQPLESMITFILPPSRRKMDGVLPSEKGRLDMRYFSAQSIQGRYREHRDLWARYDLTTKQGRNEFIKSRGFEVFQSPKYMTFDIMPDCLMNIENGNVIRNIQKISITALADRNSDDTINLLNKQKEMEYYQSLDNSEIGSFQKFLINATNIMLDFLNGQNN